MLRLSEEVNRLITKTIDYNQDELDVIAKVGIVNFLGYSIKIEPGEMLRYATFDGIAEQIDKMVIEGNRIGLIYYLCRRENSSVFAVDMQKVAVELSRKTMGWPSLQV